jgi:hypothetical protein
LPSWLTWLMAGLIVGSVLLALAVGGIYYLLNEAAPTSSPADYEETAIFKLTATRQAVDNLGPSSTPFVPTPTTGILPTNTFRPTLPIPDSMSAATKTGDLP